MLRRVVLSLLPLVLCLLLPPVLLHSALRKEFKSLEEFYQKGKLDELADALIDAKAANNEERALLLYLNAMLKVEKVDTVSLLDQAATKYPTTLYGQRSMLEQAKIHVLDRNAAAARILLQKITSTSLLERYYWLGVCAELEDDHASVINHAENYLRLDSRGSYVEEAHFLLALAYQAQGKHQSAVSTLNQLASKKDLQLDEQYFHYLLGLSHHKAGNYSEALANYRRGLELNKYSQTAFQIEDQLFELHKVYGSRIDLSFLYPYEELDLPIIVSNPEPVTVSPPPQQTPQLKLGAKPDSGTYIQAGRFSVEANANSLAALIRKLNLSANYFADKNNKAMPWVVISGPYSTKSEADLARDTLISNDIDCFITSY